MTENVYCAFADSGWTGACTDGHSFWGISFLQFKFQKQMDTNFGGYFFYNLSSENGILCVSSNVDDEYTKNVP